MPHGFGFEWTEIALQEKLAGNTAIIAFGLAVLFVFLLLAALYESWMLPAAVILIVPMCILAAMFGVTYRDFDRNILVDIGLIVLVGLAAKNAILIVEFAKQAEDAGETPVQAAISAARTRLRPILMTSFAFIFGVVPLVIAQGAGAEMRQSLGTAVFAGMLGVTIFGLLFTPTFYVLVRYVSLHGSVGCDATVLESKQILLRFLRRPRAVNRRRRPSMTGMLRMCHLLLAHAGDGHMLRSTGSELFIVLITTDVE